MKKTFEAISEAIRNPRHPFRKADNQPKKSLTRFGRVCLSEMAVGRHGSRLIEPLNVMNEFDVGSDVSTSCAHVARFEVLGVDEVREVCAESAFHCVSEQAHERIQ